MTDHTYDKFGKLFFSKASNWIDTNKTIHKINKELIQTTTSVTSPNLKFKDHQTLQSIHASTEC